MKKLKKPKNAIEKTSRTKGGLAAGAAAGSAVLLAAGAWPVGIVVAGISGWAAWDWFRYRARHGMRF